MAREIKTRISIDGEAKFKASLTQVNSQLRVLASEVKAASAAFDKNKATVEDYEAVNKALAKQIEQQKIKTEALKSAVADAREAYEKAKSKADAMTQTYGDNSEQAQRAAKEVEAAQKSVDKWSTALNSSQAELNRLNIQYRRNTESIEQLNAQTEELSSSTGESAKKSEKSRNALDLLSKIDLSKVADGAEKIAKGLAKITTASVKALTNEVKISTQAFAAYQTAVASSAAALAGFSVNTGMDFEESMSNVQALKGISKTSEAYQQFEEAAKKMGQTTSKTATEAADALGYMALAGWTNEEMLTGLEPILRASEAGAMDLATCSDMVTDSMSAYGVEVEELPRYLDAVTAAQNNSNTNMQQALEAYISGGGMLKSMNVPLEESATLFGILANRGKKGAEAGNALSSILVNLIGTTKKTSKALDTLGVSMYDADGNRKTTTQTLQDLSKALATCSDEEKDAFTAVIGGKTQLDTLLALLGGVCDEAGNLTDEYKDLYAAIENSDGALENTAVTKLDNLKGSLTLLKSAADGFGIEYSQKISEPLRNAVDTITEYLNRITAVFKQGGTEGVANFFSRLKNDIADYISSIIPSLAEHYSEFSSAFNKITLDMFDVGLETAPAALRRFIPVMTDSFSQMITGIAERLPDTINIITNALNELIPGIMISVNHVLSSLSENLPEMLEDVISILFSDIHGISSNIMSIAREFINAGEAIAYNLLKAINDNLPELSDVFTRAISMIFDVSDSMLPDIIQLGGNILKSLLDGLISNLPSIVTYAGSIISSLCGYITDALPYLVKSASDILAEIGKGLIDNIDMLLDAAIDIVLSLVEFIAYNTEPLFEGAMIIIDSLCTELITGDNLARLINGAMGIVKGIAEGIFLNIPLLTDAVVNIIDGIGDYLSADGNLERLLKDASAVLEAIARGLMDSLDLAVEVIKQLCDTLIQIILDTDWAGVGEQIINGIMSGLMPEDVEFDIKDYCENFVSYWKAGWKINSPSRVMRDEVGVYLVPGIVEGIDETSEQLNDSIKNTVKSIDTSNINASVSESLNYDDLYQISFISNISDILSQLDDVSDQNAKLSLFAEYSESDIGRISNAGSSPRNSNSDNTLNKICEKLTMIESSIANMQTTIHTTNYLYPNSNALRDTVNEIMLVNNAVTGGR